MKWPSVLIHPAAFSVISYPTGARRAHSKLLKKYVYSEAMSLGNDGPKPVEEAEKIAPEFFAHLRFGFDLAIRLIEFTGKEPVTSFRFRNPPYGFVFLEEDLVTIVSDFPRQCALRAAGNKMEYGNVIINQKTVLDFTGEFSGVVDFCMGLPNATEENAEARAEVAREVAAAYGLTITPGFAV